MTAIPQERKHGFVRCACTSATSQPLVGWLATFGLRLDEQHLLEVGATTAQTIVESLLSRSFVGTWRECIPTDRARALAQAFVADVGGEAAKYYSNGQWDQANNRSWTPLTESVFDGGVIAVGPSIAACVWIEEDD